MSYPQPAAPSPAPQTAPWGGPGESDKSFLATWLFAWLLGGLGVDRFYLGKIGTGVAKLLTLGGLGIWALVDLVLVLVGAQRDKEGRRLAGYEQYKKIAWTVTAVVIVLGIVANVVSGSLLAGSTTAP